MKKISYTLILLLCTFFISTKVAFALDLAGSANLTATANVASPITDLQITGDAAATTPVKLFVTSGSLAMSTMTGLTFTGSNTGSVLYFSGTVANINAALATLTYTRSGTGSDTLEVSLVNSGEVFFSGNGHLYKFISGSTTWNSAFVAAATQTSYGATGYLATITSQTENDFISGRIVADGWIGASDSATEGDWKWVAGPETGTSFWSGAGASSGGHTVNSGYANWNTGEPNDSGGNEDCAEYYSGTSRWNDLPCSGSTLSGYMVEFGTPGALPTVVAKNISITTEAYPAISSIVPTNNATAIVPSANLSITFNKIMQVGTGNIIIKKTADNTTVQTIDVASGQVTGSGTNTITINPSTDLSYNTSYYVQIGNTAFHDTGNNNFAGISNTTSWVFTTQTAYTLTYTAGSNGSLTGTASQLIVTGGNGSAITAVPSAGYTFINWSDLSTANPRTDTGVVSNLGVTANFADITPPVISNIAVSRGQYSAVVSWNTNEDSSSLVVYGTSDSYGSTTTEIDISPRVQAHSMYLAGLTCNTTYYVNPKSSDASTNQGIGTGTSFTTTACPHSGGGGVVTPKAIQKNVGDDTTALNFIINSGESAVSSNTLTIHLNADSTKVSGYAISLDPTFAGGIILPLPKNNIGTYTLPNTYGTYTVYMQYYSTTGNTSKLISHTMAYAANKSVIKNNTTVKKVDTKKVAKKKIVIKAKTVAKKKK